jgi:putative ABC transport system permease protein
MQGGATHGGGECLSRVVNPIGSARDPDLTSLFHSSPAHICVPRPFSVASYNSSVRLLFEIFGQTLRTLWAHKLRSFLTMFGIAWGVFSLLLLVGLGEGFRSGNKKQFDSLGENVMFIWSGRAPMMYYLTHRDYLDIQRDCPSVGLVAPVISRSDIRAVSDFYQASGQINGSLAMFNQIRYLPINEGRWLNDMDVTQKRKVIVLGDEARRTLFSGRAAVGSTILLNGVSFEVIGTIQRIGHGDNNNLNFKSFIPYTTMREYFPPLNTGEGRDVISLIEYQPRTRAVHELSRQEVHKVIGRNHGFDPHNPDSFDEWDTVDTVDQVGKIFDAMNEFLGSVGLVTLGLGAIGIINIMLVAVADRTQEIGLRKALGATNTSIMFQFFVEGAFLTLLSGILGIAAAAGVMAALSGVDLGEGFDPPRLVVRTAALAVISLAVAGVAAGLYPARKAAGLQPVEALRKE